MSDVSKLALRLAILGVVAVVLQTAAISQLSLLGTAPNVLPLVVAFAGLLCGAIPGAIMGFAVGLFADLALVQDVGVSSLLFVCIGYGAGRLRELRDPAHTLVPLAVGAAAGLLAACGVAVIQLMLGVGAPVSLGVVRDILAGTLIAALLSLPVHAIVRRLLAPALPEAQRRRSRRAYTTGGLSPLSSSRG